MVVGVDIQSEGPPHAIVLEMEVVNGSDNAADEFGKEGIVAPELNEPAS